MANIHTILAEGSAIQLGPVTVTKAYPRKPGDKNRFVLIEDSSGKGALKIWGAAANTELAEGQVITLVGTGPKGGVKTSEWQGKTSIDANDCRLELGSGGSQQPAQASVEHVGYDAPRQQSQAAHASSGAMQATPKDMQIIRQNALTHATNLIVAAGVSNAFADQTSVLRLAERYAHYSATGEIGDEVDYIPM